jgi:large subunit ribosomal protein L7/L12
MSKFTWHPEVSDLGDRIAALPIARAAELHRYLETVYRIKVAAGVAPSPDHRLREEDREPTPPVPTEFRVVLESFDPTRKISVIKVVRELSGMGLKEAKDLVEAFPRVVKEGVSEAEAEDTRARLESAGARVSVVGILP